MNIKSINKLKQNPDKSYDLSVNITLTGYSTNLIPFICEKKHEMRIDLVCFDIYQNTDNIDVLVNLNSITNVFNIQSGDIIYYIDEEEIDNVIVDDTEIDNIKKQILTANKSKNFKPDVNREKDKAKRQEVEKNKIFIPPNILGSNKSNLMEENGKIRLGPNF